MSKEIDGKKKSTKNQVFLPGKCDVKKRIIL